MDDTRTHEGTHDGRTHDRTADRSAWQALLEQITLERRGQAVTLEVLDPELGDQTPVHRLPLDSIGYDPHDDVVVVGLSGAVPGDEVVVRHLVVSPRSIDQLDRPDGSLVLRVVDGADVQTLVVLTPA